MYKNQEEILTNVVILHKVVNVINFLMTLTSNRASIYV